MDIKVFLLSLIEQLKKAELDPIQLSDNKEIKKLHNELYFLSLTNNSSKLHPNNIQNFLLLMQKEIGRWGIFSKIELEEEGIPEDLTILDDYIGISEEADYFYANCNSSFDEVSQIIEDVLIYCRNTQLQNEYVSFRKFLIKNPISSRRDITRVQIQNQFDPFLCQTLEKCYEEIPKEAEYSCQTCGWTLIKKANRYVCGKKTCREDFNLQSLTQNKIEISKHLRVKKPILLSVVIPGIPELDFASELENVGIDVELYPNLERLGDLKATYNSSNYYIDMKDYSDYRDLVSYLIEEKNRIKTPYIVISESKTNLRKNRTPQYVKKVNKKLEDEGITHFKLYSCSEMKNLITKGV